MPFPLQILIDIIFEPDMIMALDRKDLQKDDTGGKQEDSRGQNAIWGGVLPHIAFWWLRSPLPVLLGTRPAANRVRFSRMSQIFS